METQDLKNWRDIEAIFEQSYTRSDVFFRGQSDYHWSLKPSIKRLVESDKISQNKAEYYEKQSQFEFLSQVHLIDDKFDYNSQIDPVSILVNMQHYSCPTRLLDWSESLFVALYFAVSSSFNSDASIFIWHHNTYLKHLENQYPNIKFDSENLLNSELPDFLTPIVSRKKNERLLRQQGVFSVSNNILKDHDEIIIETAKTQNSKSGLFKFRIPKEQKLEFLIRLRKMNITSESLFPGMDGMGKTINESLLIRQYLKK